MKYKEVVKRGMEKLAEDEKVVFMGQGLLDKSAIFDTMSNIESSRLIEFPVAENLIVGAALGLSLRGWKPVVIFQRADFLTVAADAIINHLAQYPKLGIKCPVVIRVIVGSQSSDFYCGCQHTKDLTTIFEGYIKRVSQLRDINHIYNSFPTEESVMTVEYKDLYETEVDCG